MDAWKWGREDRLAGSGVKWGVVPDYREGKAEEKQGKASTEDGGLKTQRQMEEEDGNLEAEYDPITECGSRSWGFVLLRAAVNIDMDFLLAISCRNFIFTPSFSLVFFKNSFQWTVTQGLRALSATLIMVPHLMAGSWDIPLY